MNPKIKISQLPAKGANLAGGDLLEIAEFTGTGYVSKSITGQEIIDAAAGSGGVTAVTGSAPIVSTGGTTPDIQIRQSSNVDDGYLSATDWITFNEKQNQFTLTTTGTSGPATFIADTLNIPQYSGGGGGGLQGVHALFGPLTGYVVSNNLTPVALSSTLQTANRIISSPFISGQTFTSSNLFIRVFVAVPSALAKILIYSDLSGKPNTLLFESTNIDCSTIGNKTITTSFTFTAGTIYWLTFWSNLTPTVFTIPQSNMITLRTQGSVPSPSNNVNVIVTYGSAPTTLSGTGESLAAMPFIGITQA